MKNIIIRTFKVNKYLIRITVKPNNKHFFTERSIVEIQSNYDKYLTTLEGYYFYNRPKRYKTAWNNIQQLNLDVKKEDEYKFIEYIKEKIELV